MHARCIIVLAFLTIPLSFGLVSVDAPSSAGACQAVQLTWEGGVEPWSLSILSASASNSSLHNLGTSTSSLFTWTVDVPPGTSVALQVQDSTGDVGQSPLFTIQQGTSIDGHCFAGASTSPMKGQVGGGPDPLSSGVSSAAGDGSGSGEQVASTSGVKVPGPSSPQGGFAMSTNDTTSAPPQSGSGLDSSGSSSTSISSGSAKSVPSPNRDIFSSPSSATSSFVASTRSSDSTPASNPSLSGSILPNPAAQGTLSSESGAVAVGEQAGPTLGSTTAIASVSGTNAGTRQTAGSLGSASSPKSFTGPIIGGIIAAVLCGLLAVFCVLRRCRHRRSDMADRIYPFSAENASEGPVPREMVGRSGYAASTFSSWGNHGDLADERALSPATAGASTDSRPWEAAQAQGTFESRYAAAFTPGHTASSSSVDRNDPDSQRRFRGPNPKNMINVLHPTYAVPPSLAVTGMGEPWRRHEPADGRRPIVVSYAPSYTTK